MFTHLRFRNFKSWEDTKRIRLAPITIFFGANSSGKSSLGQLLLLLKQTVESSDRTRVLDTGDETTAVDVGSYAEFIHHHDLTRTLEFELAWDLDKPLVVTDSKVPSFRFSTDHLTFQAAIEGQAGRSRPIRVNSFEYTLAAEGADQQAPVRVGLARSEGNRYEPTFRGYEPYKTIGRPRTLPAPAKFYGFPDEAMANYQNTEFLADLGFALERALDTVRYLGPLRTEPERTYIWTGGAPDEVGSVGERTVEALLGGGDRKFNLREHSRLKSLQDTVAEQLAGLGLISEFQVEPIARDRPEHEVAMRVPNVSDRVMLPDAGFGVSQVLPVVVQGFVTPSGSTIVMEQPEIHLHPSAQKALADYFIDASLARENAQPRETQFIIESHSEHLLRRMQRRIAEKRVPPEHVALYFCEVAAGRSRLRPLDIDLFGNISNWPKDFFGDPVEDIAIRAEKQLEAEIES
jgi:predicted ATPase